VKFLLILCSHLSVCIVADVTSLFRFQSTTLALMDGRSSQEMMSGSCTTSTTQFRKLLSNSKWPRSLLHEPDLLHDVSWAHVSRTRGLWKHLVYELWLVLSPQC
jgi:hypothetical protein